ncbi:hypothetical protein E4U34_007357 [Claviceps purpurea]|nr:hypothetical protein E4U34_007357 [Claviceps purpurea]
MKVLSLNVVPFFPRGLPKDQVNDTEKPVAPNKLDGERIDSVHSNLVPLDEIRLSNAAMGGTMDVPTGFGQFTEAKMSRGAQVLWETTTQLFPESQHVMYIPASARSTGPRDFQFPKNLKGAASSIKEAS